LLRCLAIALVLVAAGCSSSDPYTGEPYVRSDKIVVRRPDPNADEIANRPPPPYEQVLRAQEAERARLAVSPDMEAKSLYLERSAKVFGQAASSPRDPWEALELDRRRVLAREWADEGPYPKLDPIVKPEQTIEDDPFKVIPKVTKKAAADGDAPAAPAADGDKPAGDADKKDMGGDKKD
jgi:hypothetical protein